MARKRTSYDRGDYGAQGGTRYWQYAGRLMSEAHQDKMERRHREEETAKEKYYAEKRAKALDKESNLIPSRNTSGQSGVKTFANGKKMSARDRETVKNAQSISKAGTVSGSKKSTFGWKETAAKNTASINQTGYNYNRKSQEQKLRQSSKHES